MTVKVTGIISSPLVQGSFLNLDTNLIYIISNAIIHTIVYADIFDYPLTAKEVYIYLINVKTTFIQTKFILDNFLVPNRVLKYENYYILPGRESIVATRVERSKIAKKLWLKAITYTSIISKLPFVRMVAITGSLAVSNPDKGDDIDLFVVTEANRLWISRLSIILIKKLAKLLGIDLCPNFLITEQELLFRDQTIYTARELLQMVPLTGKTVYAKIYQINAWVKEFFPNSLKIPALYKLKDYEYHHSRVQKLLELFLCTRALDKVELWEMRRTSAKLTRLSDSRAENKFTMNCCKSHLDGYQKRTLNTYSQRLKELDQKNYFNSVL